MLKNLLRWLLGIFFVLAGLNHFREPALYVAMLPPWTPQAAGLSAIAGAFEILGGIGLLLPGTRRAAGWGLIALLVAVLPANLYVAHLGHMEGFSFSPTTLWLRLPLQAVPIAWTYWVAIARERALPI